MGGGGHRYRPLTPISGALLAMLEKVAPAVDCMRVLMVSRGNSASVETHEAMPPARAAVSSVFAVRWPPLLLSEGGGPADFQDWSLPSVT